MKLKLIQIRDALSNSFWFVPAIMALLAGTAALGSVSLDYKLGNEWVGHIGWLWSGGADGARSVLSVIATSFMTVVSIVFPLTVTTLAQTSSHFGPRVLRNFTSNRGVQFALGTFISTFVYCLLVLRTVRSVEEANFVPALSVNLAVMLAIASLAVLIHFIHYVSQSIQPENLIAEIGFEFRNSLKILFPEHIGEPGRRTDLPVEPEDLEWEKAPAIVSTDSGYLQRMDHAGLMLLAEENDLILKLLVKPGDFIMDGSPLLKIYFLSGTVLEMEAPVRNCFSLGRSRTPHQDALYMIQQMVEIGAHALSPGINEPYTALTCIDWLGDSLHSVAVRDLPSPLRVDDEGMVRIIAPRLAFEELTHAAFDQIRIYGASNPDIMTRLLEVIQQIAPDLHRDNDRDVLRYHANLIGEDASKIVNASDQMRVKNQLNKTLKSLSS